MNTLGIEQAARELFRNSPGGETDERWEELPADERDWYRDRVRDVLRVYGEFAEAQHECECAKWVENVGERDTYHINEHIPCTCVHSTKLADGDVWIEGRLSEVRAALAERCAHQWVTRDGETRCSACDATLGGKR